MKVVVYWVAMPWDEIKPDIFIKSWIKLHSSVTAETEIDNKDYKPFLD